jgi:hypothetical protein
MQPVFPHTYKIECVFSFPDFVFRRVPNIYKKGSIEVLHVETVAIDGDCQAFTVVHMIHSVLQPRRLPSKFICR